MRERGEYAVKVRVRGGYQTYVVDYHPFDVVGWDGYLYPWTFSIHDFEPITGRIHQPPPSHQTFQGQNFVICSFCPRKLDFDPLAVPIPYHHSNLQSEEMIYYVSGNFGSRKGVEVGSITLDPSGLPHGPQPGLAEKAIGLHETHELAVMCDLSCRRCRRDRVDCQRRRRTLPGEVGSARLRSFLRGKLGSRLRERRELQTDLRNAPERGDLLLHYQPQKTIAFGKVVGFEALARWHCPKRGWVSPETFIPIAEQSTQIIALGEWILREACKEAASWPNSAPGCGEYFAGPVPSRRPGKARPLDPAGDRPEA